MGGTLVERFNVDCVALKAGDVLRLSYIFSHNILVVYQQ